MLANISSAIVAKNLNRSLLIAQQKMQCIGVKGEREIDTVLKGGWEKEQLLVKDDK